MNTSFLSSAFSQLKNPFNSSNNNTSDKNNFNFGIIYTNKQREIIINIINNFSHNPNIEQTIFFTIDDVDITKETVKGIVLINNKFEDIVTKIPPFIYNTSLHTKPSSIKTMRQLRVMENVSVINPINRFHQDIIFDMISSFAGSKSFILPYTTFSKESLFQFLEEYESIFIIPQRGVSHHKGIIVNKNHHQDGSKYVINIGINEQEFEESILYNTIKKITGSRKYLIMKSPPFIYWNDSPLEVRAYIQKGLGDSWAVTSLIAKNQIFSTGSIYNNTSSNFRNVLLNNYSSDVGVLERNLYDISTNICTYMDHFMPNLGSITLDYIIDTEGNPYLIFVGGFEQEMLLYNLKDEDGWLNYIKNILEYITFQKSTVEKGVKK